MKPASNFALMLAVSLLSTRAAAADPDAPQPQPPTKTQCIDADAEAQSLRMSGKFLEAKKQLSMCAASVCPQLVRDDCAQRLDDVNKATPTIVLAAQDAMGKDRSDVKVTVDGVLVAERLDGLPIPLDPGPHKFVFEVAGQAPFERALVLREGEKDRHESVIIPASAATAPSVTPAPSTNGPTGRASGDVATYTQSPEGPADDSGSGRSQRTWGLVLGGVGLAGIAAGSVFGAMAIGKWNQSQNDCSASTVAQCTDHGGAVTAHDAAVTDGTVSTVAFGIGVAALAGGALLFVFAPRDAATGSVRIDPLVGSHEAGLVGRATF